MIIPYLRHIRGSSGPFQDSNRFCLVGLLADLRPLGANPGLEMVFAGRVWRR